MDSQASNKPLRVFLWIVPRTNSTVFTKCMSFVDNTEVLMEPFMACMLNETFYNPEWGVEIPQMVKLRAFMTEIMQKEELLALKKQEVEKARKYKNVWLQDKFRYFLYSIDQWRWSNGKVRTNAKLLHCYRRHSHSIYHTTFKHRLYACDVAKQKEAPSEVPKGKGTAGGRPRRQTVCVY
ncbi:hypothetical protein HOLleu_14057 [Holothuria leucospilota]|uniref:Uncharacterized protein n=1 Tax=Holothuria leucospilota TaxID=206669 RepID=A0A9Q1C8I0_HOLLE|nr:hypothetical protein HOLleu_14057 [Holothuria leucospilota]